MSWSIAHLGPPGTYAEEAALKYATWLSGVIQQPPFLCPYASIAQTLRSVAEYQTQLAVVPVENSIEGSVTMTLDTLWQLENLQIQQALILPIAHMLITDATELATVRRIYSHPQALSQCQKWLEQFVPQAELIPANSTTEALQYIQAEPNVGVIASRRAAELHKLAVRVNNIQDHPDNCTRFLIVANDQSAPQIPKQTAGQSYTSVAFSVPANLPGALVKPLQIFADRQLNLSRIESRPSKRSLGDYVFFVDIEANLATAAVQSAMADLTPHTEVLKIFGSYTVLNISST